MAFKKLLPWTQTQFPSVSETMAKVERFGGYIIGRDDGNH